MSQRTRAREVALQLMFQRDQNPTAMTNAQFQTFVRDRLKDQSLIAFATLLYNGTGEHLKSIDTLLQKHAENWRIKRMMPVDRNVMRLCIYEMVHGTAPEDRPAYINEAIEIARRYGTANSPSFVNGILDAVLNELPRNAKPKAQS